LADPNFKIADNVEDNVFSSAASQQLFNAAGEFIGGALLGDSGTGTALKGLLGGDYNTETDNGKYGFAFPILEDLGQVFGLLLGKPAVLVTYDLPPFFMDFTMEMSFPIYPPLYGVVSAGVGLQIDFAFGYDTQGIQDFIEGGASNPLDLLSGLYISDTDNPDGSFGTDVPELKLWGGIGVGAELNLGIASAGVMADISITFNFDLYDPDSDGRVRITELVGTFMNEINNGDPIKAPLAIFDIYGDIAFQLSAYIEILFAKFDFDITPRIVIWEFEIPFERPPILATERGDGSLLLNIGPNSGARLNGDTRDIDEDISVKDAGGGKVAVWGMGVSESAAQIYDANAIYGYGGEGNDTIDLHQVGSVPVYLEGGSGNDTLLGGGRDDSIHGGIGDDSIDGGGGHDRLWGDEGHDFVRGGAGNDFIFGDGAFVAAERITALGSNKDGNDTIYGDDGNDVIFGGGGDDSIYGGDNAGGADGYDLIFGDSGRIELGAGGALPESGGVWNLAKLSARGLVSGNDLIFGNAGTDLVFGGKGDDIIDGGADHDVLYGNEGFDTVYGGGGEDEIYGGTEDDRIFGGRDDLVDAAKRDVTDATADLKDTIYGEDGNDFIRGNLGNDTIHGQRGADIIFGDEDDDTIFGEGDPDFIFGGAGNDYIEGQAGNDAIFGDDGIIVYVDFYGVGSHKVIGLVDVDVDPDPMVEDLVPTPDVHTVDSGTLYALDPYIESTDDFGASNPTETRNRTLDLLLTLVNGATDGNDTVIGGEGDDLAFGGAKDDILFGDLDPAKPLSGPVPAGEDILIGDGGRVQYFGRRLNHVSTVVAASALETGADAVSGNGADDLIFGGGGNDTLYGRMDSSYSGPNEDPLLTDNDIIVGDDGQIDYTAGTGVIEKIATTISMPAIVTGGSDIVYGNTGDDIIFGGMKGDTLYGDGSTGGDDIILGDNGQIDFTGGVIDRIATTDTFEASGGPDTIDGQAGNDIILGGVNNDDGAGDPEFDLIVGNLGDDVILGDNGLLDFAFGGDTDLTSLDLIQSEIKGLGGEDRISGNAGEDVVIGSTGGDIIYGDASGAPAGAADGQDILLGDNGIIRLLGGVDGRLTVRGTAVRFIHTTDENNDYGGADTIEGNADADVIIGGVNGTDTTAMDELYGDALSPDIHDGNDLILGDNALLHFAYDGDTDLESLDIVATRPYKVGEASILDETFLVDDSVILGGDDLIAGHTGSDAAFGGVGSDIIYGDAASPGTTDQGDILVGDNAEILLDGSVDAALYVLDSAVRLIQTTDTEEPTGGADTISGNAGADVILGGVNNGGTDVLYGDRAVPTAPSIAADGDDVLLGDNGLLDFAFGDADLTILDLIRSSEDGLGGTDIISGNKGLDAAIGGTGGDVIYGDDASASAAGADLGDLLLGDNADVFLTARGGAVGGDLKTVLGSAVYLIRTTDEEHPGYGGSDTISGNAGGDIMAGGVNGDTLYGDRLDPTTANGKNTTLLDGDDIILGDNGAFEWLSRGRLSEVLGIDVEANNPALWAKYGNADADDDLTTLDLVTTEQPNSGGRDLIHGDDGSDLLFGGTDADVMYGDDATLDEVADSANNDVMFGDHGRLYPQFSTLPDFNSRNFFAIDTGDGDGGEGDRMWGEEGDDGMLGQQGDDRMWGGAGDDDMTGGHNVSGGFDELTATAIDAALGSPIAMPDIDTVNDIMDGGTGDDAMAGDNAIVWRRGDDLSPRFRTLTADAIYSTTNSAIDTNIDAEWQSDPADAIGRDIELVDHADTTATGLYGSDVMAGGADSDVMFGQLANDLMQGDGSIGADDGDTETITYLITVEDDVDPDEELHFNIPEAASDGDDYLEGGGGGDLMYGGLGQDDMIGGSSALFGLETEAERPDASDVIFGGAGIDIARNDLGDATLADDSDIEAIPENTVLTSPGGHARDADFIMGDNANVYRLVQEATDEFLTFNYDTYEADAEPATYDRIIPRAMEQLDYTLGGADFRNGHPELYPDAVYTDGAADLDGDGTLLPADNGAADLIHGESGDDVIFGMTGSDVIFGEGQDDDIVGGYGHDWISGGTGRDGVLGDDGLVLTSRNSTLGEPLYGIEGLLTKDPRPKYADGNVLNEIIYTPGSIQYAVINVQGELKKTMDLVPFSFDPAWNAQDDEFPDDDTTTPYADDIIFGGLGSDWLHGGSGDDAISGAEALEHAYVPVYAANGDPYAVLDLGYLAVGLPAETNPGDVLAFSPTDADGQHTNNRFRAGEFDLYDEYDPRLKIMLDSTGELWKSAAQGTAYEFLLNFNTDEGVVRPEGYVPKATGQQTEYYPEVFDDGRDAVFGDLGNDWLVGGTGADDIFGGWGNDLINADDDHATNGNLNDIPDTHPYYQDRAYGGAGRDVLIGNTGGDRLIDWVGEYNSYLVPYAPFGQASVSRTLQPFLPEFLYALSAGDGADFTRPGDTGADPLRNGEPDAELGIVLQKDFAWQDQTGAPADPQAGNIPGGARDVLRSAGFNDGTADGFYIESGVWAVTSGRFEVAPTTLGGDALSVFYVDEYVPNYFEMTATIRAVKPIGGFGANSYLVFDYQSSEDFKFAGINVSTSKLEIGCRDAAGWHVLSQAPYTGSMKADTDYNVFLALNGSTAILRVNNRVTLTYAFDPRLDEYGYEHFLHEGMVGLGANNAKAAIDNVTVQRVAPETTFEKTMEFDSAADLDGFLQTPDAGSIDGGRLVLAAAPGSTAVDLYDMTVAPASVLSLETVLGTAAGGGFVFDAYGPQDFKFVAVSTDTSQVILGHSTSRTGLVVDAAWNAPEPFEPGADSTLGITIAERSVSVTLDGKGVLSFAFNSLVTDGGFGLLAIDGAALFDRFTLTTDDPAYSTPALPTLSVGNAAVTEGDEGLRAVTVTFTLSTAAETPVTVAYATADGTATSGEDYLYQTGTLTFEAGETGKDVTFYVKGDTAVETDETFAIVLSDPVGATIDDGSGTVVIANDDADTSLPAISIADVSKAEGDKTNKTKVSITISLSRAATEAVTVQLATADGTAVSGQDYVAADTTLTFAPGETSKAYTLVINGDKVAEPDEAFFVKLSNATGASIAKGVGTVTILNDDGSALTAAEPASGVMEGTLLTADGLDSVVEAAIGRWAGVLGGSVTTALQDVEFQVADFSGRVLGLTGGGTVYLDADAAGYGWFVDPTPLDDGEFTGAAPAGMDLMTAVMHEIGHVLGFRDVPAALDSLMSGTLEEGVRRLPDGLATLTMPQTSKSSLLHFAPPSNGIPSGWIFEHGTVTGDTSGSGWLKKLAKRFKGRAAHDTLPALVTLTRGSAFHNPVEGAGETAKLLVSMEMQAAANTDGDGAAVKGSGWLGDFLLDGNGKANPNKRLKIVL
jgi:Ca2+-binding RTX toxin-like protein